MKRKPIGIITIMAAFVATALSQGLCQSASSRSPRPAQSRRHFPLPSHYRLTDLGTLPGADSSEAAGLNGQGDVVGAVSRLMSFVTIPLQPFLYRNGQMHSLGLLPGMTVGYALAVNQRGEVIGEMDCLKTHSFHKCAFVWQDGILKSMDIPHGYVDDEAKAINDKGQVVGSVADSKSRSTAVLWQDGRIHRLGTIRGFGSSVATAVNNRGQVAGYVEGTGPADAPAEALLYERGRMRGLGRLGGDESKAHALNERGWVVGESTTGKQDNQGNPVVHPFLWRRGQRMQDLGSLGGTYAQAYGVNDRGQVVGAGTRTDGHDHAFLWQRGVLSDLNTLIPPGSGWFLADAYAINSRGQIVGTGVVNGHERAFLLTPR